MLKSYRVLNRTGFTKVRFAVPTSFSLCSTPSYYLHHLQTISCSHADHTTAQRLSRSSKSRQRFKAPQSGTRRRYVSLSSLVA